VAACSATLAASLATFVAALTALEAKLLRAPNPNGMVRARVQLGQLETQLRGENV